MSQKSNKIENFWQELKRRKVVHVITVYAAIAFVILQLVDMVAEPLRLPFSTKALVIVLLCIGFVIAIFVSWVYDIKRYNHLFNSIRNEPEFQQIAKDMEAKYQTEHERVKKWLEEQGMI